MTITHRIAQGLGLCLLWMLLWATFGALVSIVIGIVDPPSIDPGEGPIDIARILGGVGAGTGVVFGLLLAAGERHRTINDVPLWRAAIWGTIAGAVLPLLTDINESVLTNTCPLGALTGMLSVALARRIRRSRQAVRRA